VKISNFKIQTRVWLLTEVHDGARPWPHHQAWLVLCDLFLEIIFFSFFLISSRTKRQSLHFHLVQILSVRQNSVPIFL